MTTATLESSATPEGTQAVQAPARLTSVDAYRGLVMFLMMAEVLNFCHVATARPDADPRAAVAAARRGGALWTGAGALLLVALAAVEGLSLLGLRAWERTRLRRSSCDLRGHANIAAC